MGRGRQETGWINTCDPSSSCGLWLNGECVGGVLSRSRPPLHVPISSPSGAASFLPRAVPAAISLALELIPYYLISKTSPRVSLEGTVHLSLCLPEKGAPGNISGQVFQESSAFLVLSDLGAHRMAWHSVGTQVLLGKYVHDGWGVTSEGKGEGG